MKKLLTIPISRATLMLFACLAFTGGCSNKLTVVGNFPTPVINSLPYTVGVFYDENFSSYEYKEENEDRTNWKIKTGDAQTRLFSTILPAMFNKVVVLDAIGNNNTLDNVDLIIAPSLTDFQYNVPSETKVDMFEIWMKFNIKVFESDGELIADWIMTSYGKTPSAFMQTKQTALNEAVNVALRDAGANLSLTFTRVPEVRMWLKNQQLTKDENVSN